MHGPQRHPSTPLEAIASRIGHPSATRPIIASRHRTRPCHGPDPTRRYSQNSKGCRAANLALARAPRATRHPHDSRLTGAARRQSPSQTHKCFVRAPFLLVRKDVRTSYMVVCALASLQRWRRTEWRHPRNGGHNASRQPPRLDCPPVASSLPSSLGRVVVVETETHRGRGSRTPRGQNSSAVAPISPLHTRSLARPWAPDPM